LEFFKKWTGSISRITDEQVNKYEAMHMREPKIPV